MACAHRALAPVGVCECALHEATRSIWALDTLGDIMRNHLCTVALPAQLQLDALQAILEVPPAGCATLHQEHGARMWTTWYRDSRKLRLWSTLFSRCSPVATRSHSIEVNDTTLPPSAPR